MNAPIAKPMDLAFAEAEAALSRGEVPVGAVIVTSDGEILARAGNEIIARHDPTAHAELLAIRHASSTRQNERLADCDLYVTLEPCTMCAAAIALARIRRLYFAAFDAKAGAVDHGVTFFNQKTCHHRPEVYGGIEEERARRLLKDFFAERR